VRAVAVPLEYVVCKVLYAEEVAESAQSEIVIS